MAKILEKPTVVPKILGLTIPLPNLNLTNLLVPTRFDMAGGGGGGGSSAEPFMLSQECLNLRFCSVLKTLLNISKFLKLVR